MSFVRLWLTTCYNPVKMIEELRSKPAPQWGFYAQLLRAALDSLLPHLPIALKGRIPHAGSLSFLLTEQYYWHLIWLSPIVLAVQWLPPSAFIHWAGQPLRTWEILLAYLRGTTTTTGLTVPS